jgi:hypothetical protein
MDDEQARTENTGHQDYLTRQSARPFIHMGLFARLIRCTPKLAFRNTLIWYDTSKVHENSKYISVLELLASGDAS